MPARVVLGFLGRLYGPEITYARRTFLFLVRHFSWMSLPLAVDVSHSQPTLHCELSVPRMLTLRLILGTRALVLWRTSNFAVRCGVFSVMEYNE